MEFWRGFISSIIFSVSDLAVASPIQDFTAKSSATPSALISTHANNINSYARVGASYNRYTFTSNMNFTSSGAVITPFDASSGLAAANANFDYRQITYLVGLRVGAGMETFVMPNISVAADFVFSFYPNLNLHRTADSSIAVCDPVAGCMVAPPTINNRTRAAMNDQQVMASFIYHLG